MHVTSFHFAQNHYRWELIVTNCTQSSTLIRYALTLLRAVSCPYDVTCTSYKIYKKVKTACMSLLFTLRNITP